jgi:hypothetical protein
MFPKGFGNIDLMRGGAVSGFAVLNRSTQLAPYPVLF